MNPFHLFKSSFISFISILEFSAKDPICVLLEDIKNRWQEYTEELYKKDLHDPDNHDGMSTHLEPDILKCEVKWALGSITTNKASGADGIPVELFQILKDDTVGILPVQSKVKSGLPQGPSSYDSTLLQGPP